MSVNERECAVLPPYAISFRRDGRAAVLELTGEIDCWSSIEVWPLVADLVGDGQPTDLELVLRDVSFFDAAAVRLLLELEGGVRAHHGRFTVLDPSAIVLRLLGTVGLLEHFGLVGPAPDAN